MLHKRVTTEGEIAIFDEACIYKRGEYWQFRMWLPKENKYAHAVKPPPLKRVKLLTWKFTLICNKAKPTSPSPQKTATEQHTQLGKRFIELSEQCHKQINTDSVGWWKDEVRV